MKRWIALILLILLLTACSAEHTYVVKNPGGFVFVDFAEKRAMTHATIDQINDNSDMGLLFLTEYSSSLHDSLSSFEYISNFMSNDYYLGESPNHELMYCFSGYPHDEAGMHLTSIELGSDKYHVLGVRVGDDVETAAQTLNDFGFENTDNHNQSFVKDDVTIKLLYFEDELIRSIEISVLTYYLGNFVY